MTGSEVLDDFLKIMDKNSNDTEYRALALIWLDLVFKDIQNRQKGFHWRFLEGTDNFDTAANDFDYVLTTIITPDVIDTTKVIHVYDKTNDRTYKYVPYDRFRRRIADETADTGEPYIFSIWSDDLLLYPVPDGIVTTYIDYVKMITAAADSSATCTIPDKYKNVVYDGLKVHGFQFDPDMGDWKAQQQIYEAGIQRMKDENAVVVSDMGRPVSHRAKHMMKDDVDGMKSVYFPIEDASGI